MQTQLNRIACVISALLFASSNALANEIQAISLDLLGADENGRARSTILASPFPQQLSNPIPVIEAAGALLVVDPEGAMETLAIADNLAGTYVEIASGPDKGARSSVVNADFENGLVTTEEDLSASLLNGNRLRFGLCNSLFSLFGQYNDKGLKPGTSAEEADEVIVFDATSQSPESYYFSSDLFGWVKSGEDDQLCKNRFLQPYEAVILRRKEREMVRMVFLGSKLEGASQITLQPGLNLISNISLVAGDVASSLPDEASIVDPSSVFAELGLGANDIAETAEQTALLVNYASSSPTSLTVGQ